MRAVLNVGLEFSAQMTTRKGKWSEEDVLVKLEKCGVLVGGWKVEEGVFVCECVLKEASVREDLLLASDCLLLDYVKMWDVEREEGYLIGYYAKDYGVFQKKYFKFL